MGEWRHQERFGARPLRWERGGRGAARVRRITVRGRLTVAALLAAVALSLFAALGSRSTVGQTAAPEPERSDAIAPRALLERLPVGAAALDLPAAPGGDRSTALASGDPDARGRLFELVSRVPGDGAPPGPFWVQYTLDAELTRHVFATLRRGRVALGHVVVLDPASGRILAYVSTDPEAFPPTRAYPAASLVKVVTAAAAIERAPLRARASCRYTGNPYRLPASALRTPRVGREVSLRRALATSNNHCFARLAVDAVGRDALVEALGRQGWLESPAPGHAAGRVESGEGDLATGRLGSGLAGARITPLHAALLAATLVRGERVAPRWIERIFDGEGRELALPPVPAPTRAISPGLAEELRGMLVDTTLRGTARSAFVTRGGRPRLGPVRVAGKTGSLSGRDPDGRYEWFAGLAPADDPKVAVAVLVVQGDLYWRTASQLAADVLAGVFCQGRRCDSEGADRFLRPPGLLAGLPPDPRGARSRPGPSS